MKKVAALGTHLERGLDQIEKRVNTPLKASFLGVLLGVGVIAGGIATFLFVLFLLVNVVA